MEHKPLAKIIGILGGLILAYLILAGEIAIFTYLVTIVLSTFGIAFEFSWGFVWALAGIIWLVRVLSKKVQQKIIDFYKKN